MKEIWNWISHQLDVSEELSRLPSGYIVVSSMVLFCAMFGLYAHYNERDNHVLAIAITATIGLSLFERYRLKVPRSANLTLLSAVIYSLLML